jgi:outer membrane protein insertion porin family
MKKLLLSAALVVLSAYDLSAEKVTKIEYVGCKRIEREAVEAYFPIRVGDDCDENLINSAVKILDKTGFFENVTIVMKGGVLTVTLSERPIINVISYEGNKKLSDKDIKAAIPLKEREPLSPEKVREVQQGLLDTYRKLGMYSATVNPKVIKLPDNRVNLVFEIKEGSPAGIGRIVFVGNHNIPPSDLRDVIHSKVKRWYRFFVTDDIYDSDRVSEDRVEIEKHYHNNGYADAKVTSAVAELSSDKKEFSLIFTIEEGELYRFGGISVKSLVQKIKVDGVGDDLYSKKGNEFNASFLEADSSNIVRNIGRNGMAVVVKPKLSINRQTRVVDVVYEVSESEKIYISKIVISGNTKTRDHVIRREIQFDEGDVYNQALVSMAENNIKALDYFKKVDIQTVPDPNSPDKCIVQISVEEAPTAEAMASANYSPLGGFGIDLTYHERNFYGTGKALSISLGSGRERVGRRKEIIDGEARYVKKKAKFRFLNNVQVAVMDPHLLDKDIEGTVAFHRYVTGIWDGFDVKELGGSFGISYQLSRNWTQGWEYEAAQRKFNNLSDNVSPIIRAQTQTESAPNVRDRNGKCGLSSIKHTIEYGKSFYTIFKGRFSAALSTSVAGLGGTAKHIKNDLTCAYVFAIARRSSLRVSLSCGVISRVGGKSPHVIDSFMLGADSFRGFDYAGMGPMSETTWYTTKDGATHPHTVRDFIGGTRYWKGTVEYAFPLGLPEELQTKGFVFTDFGTVWKPVDNGSKYLIKGAPTDPAGVAAQAAHITNEADKYRCTFDDKIIGHRMYDGKKLKASIGLGISLVTPFGPIKLTYAIPVKKEKYDEQYRFLISVGTTL